MTREERIAGFTALGQAIRQLEPDYKEDLFSQAANMNPWFTADNIEQALNGILHFLDPATLTNWLNEYSLPQAQKAVGIVMAGNIPLVGFHDFLCVVIAGHKAVIKLSSQDNVLLTAIIAMLIKINPKFSEQITVVDKLTASEAVIATGSDNSARYFKKYFAGRANIIRKNRISVAVLDGTETVAELQLLGNDIFSFFGMGCRNVAKIFIPAGYDMKVLLDALEGHHAVIEHHKYFNNYEYNKAIYLVNSTPHLDTGYALFTQSTNLVSPLAVIFYEEYNNEAQLNRYLADHADKIQCIVGKPTGSAMTIPMGKAQQPNLTDYADNIDTMTFLCEL